MSDRMTTAMRNEYDELYRTKFYVLDLLKKF